ncbi:sensor histidine kinase [Dactylosporangium sucinum]|uniref:histidine kinase n=1 Tax=Dactylosporangium sucinum TaxID=1424081 RepID=A0A917X5V2_9ACTN|nr:HAMP domain-containing sensor histidine kinase [Dactylosporangium sucinum]GGM83789.1 two-component sensor histidine kinase [Dactylosporangium sucinum]
MRRWRHWTVRTRIVVSVVALAGVALIAANAIGVGLLNWYLMKRVDESLEGGLRGPVPRPGASANPFPMPSVSPGTGFGQRREGERGEFSPGPAYQIYGFDSSGKLVNPEPVLLDPALFGSIPQRAAEHKPFTVAGPTKNWRVFVFPTSFNGREGYGARAVSLVDVYDTREQMLLFTTPVSLALLLLVGFATATLVRVGLSPLTRMEETAVEIADGNLSSRVVDADPHTESGRLGTALNTMLGRIEEAVGESAASERRLRQFLADAAHELRTPLTSVQGFAELYRRGGAPPGPALDEAMECIEAEVSRMRLLVNDLLTLARLDEERPLQRHPVDLLAVAADTVRDAHVRVPTRFVQLSTLDDRSVTFEPVTVDADEARIRQVVANLVSNALQHTPEDTRIVVRVGRPTPSDTPPTAAVGADLPPDLPLAAVEVGDTGPGMQAEDAARVFERLYRAEGSRSRRHGGAGLGLSIVAAIVQAHGGRVELWTAPGSGARFRVLLPAIDEPELFDDDDSDILEFPVTGFRGNSEVR